MPEDLFCSICDRDASDQCVIARWHDQNVCTDCLAHHDAIVAAEAAEDA
jgi:hypothetical protein